MLAPEGGMENAELWKWVPPSLSSFEELPMKW
jgi:hypothetical protein